MATPTSRLVHYVLVQHLLHISLRCSKFLPLRPIPFALSLLARKPHAAS